MEIRMVERDWNDWKHVVSQGENWVQMIEWILGRRLDVLAIYVGRVMAELPLLNVWPEVDLVRECRSGLGVKIPVRVRDLDIGNRQPDTLNTVVRSPFGAKRKGIAQGTHRCRANFPIHALDLPLLRSLDINDPINDSVSHRHALRPKFSA